MRISRASAVILGALLVVVLLFPGPARADFGIASFAAAATNQDGSADFLASSHPFSYTFEFEADTDAEGNPEGVLDSVEVNLPPGLVGNPLAVARCSRSDFDSGTSHCQPGSQVGVIDIFAIGLGGRVVAPVFNLIPPPGYVASFGLNVQGKVAIEGLSLEGSGSGAHLRVTTLFLPVGLGIKRVTQTIWGVPADPGHDGQRGACLESGGSCPAEAEPAALLTLPASCGSSLTTTLGIRSQEEPARNVTAGFTPREAGGEPLHLVGCGGLPFAPGFSLGTEGIAQAPTGLRIDLSLPANEVAYGRSAATLDRLSVELPTGLVLNPAAAAALAACAASEGRCSAASKIGDATAETPAIDHPLEGGIYLAAPGQNPFGSLFAVYVVLDDPLTGTLIKMPGRLDADPQTGRLNATIADLPELPFTKVDLEFPSGPRALFATPPTCGRYISTADLVPSTAPEGGTAHVESGLILTSGPGGPCSAPEPQRPVPSSLEAGTVLPVAGSPSPFILELTRADLDQHFGSFDLTLPPGLIADLGSTPLDTEVGNANVEAGIGPEPLQLGGKVYLRGPYKGSPYSLEVVVPAKAGPFDFGTIVERIAIDVDAATAQISARADPLPQILEGVPLQLRGLRIDLDRPGFIRNPTSCEPMAITGTATSSVGQVAPLSTRFQLGDCAALGLKPTISLSFSGTSRRGAHPGVRVTVRPRSSEANLREATVTLPPSELLDIRNVKAICPAERFATGSCPKGSMVGHAEVWTPLLDQPLAGNIYLRSSAGRLPVLAVSLEGEVQATFVAEVDSVHRRLRLRLGGIPDVPLEKVAIDLFGGKRGVIADTGGICGGKPRARVTLAAQNGRTESLDPRLKTRCGSG